VRIDSKLRPATGSGTFFFQKYLYGSLDEVERVHLHEKVGTALEWLYGVQEERAALVAVAVQLALHFQKARITEKAIHYLHQAGESAVHLSAYHEAIAHLNTGLALLMTLPDSADAAPARTHFTNFPGLALKRSFQIQRGK